MEQTQTQKIEFTEKQVIKEFEKEIGLKVENISEDNLSDYNYGNIRWFEITTKPTITKYKRKETQGFLVMKNEEEAEIKARVQVADDLDNEPEIFEKNWRNSWISHRISKEDTGKTISDLMSEDAVSVDGFSHFLASYDGDYKTTESGFVVMRTD